MAECPYLIKSVGSDNARFARYSRTAYGVRAVTGVARSVAYSSNKAAFAGVAESRLPIPEKYILQV